MLAHPIGTAKHATYAEYEEGGPPTFHPMHARYKEFEEGGPPTFHPMQARYN